MNKFIRKEALIAAVIAVMLIILIAAPIVLAVLFPLSAIFLYAADIVCVFGVLSEDISPAYKLGIAVPILLFPLHGAIFLLIFRYGPAKRKLDRRINKIFIDKSENCDIPGNSDKLCSYLSAKGFPLYSAENVKYYPFGDMMFADILKYVQQAKSSIYLEFFIVSEGSALDELDAALAERAAAGVDIRFLIDGAGSAFPKPRGFIKRMERLGIEVREYSPLSPAGLSVINISNHRKILAIDGKYVFCGGINIADEYMNRKVRFGIWKDGGVFIEGEAAAGFTKMFSQMWELSGGDRLNIQPPKDMSGGIAVQPFADVPLSGYRVSLAVYLDLINRAKKYVYITTPYLVCDDEMIGALCTAAQSGVDVRLILPGIPDKKYVNIITKSFYEKLIRHNVRVYEYSKGFIHCKNIICDGEIAAVGTVNLDYRSFSENFECGCVIYDREVTGQIKRDFDITFTDCELITIEKAGRLTWFVKVARIFLELLAPLM